MSAPKADAAMEDTPPGMHMESSEVQPEKAFAPIEVVAGGNMTCSRREHPANAELPTDATDGGIMMLVRHTQSLNASVGMVVVESGMVTVGRHPNGWACTEALHEVHTRSDVGVGGAVSKKGRTHGGLWSVHGKVPSAEKVPLGQFAVWICTLKEADALCDPSDAVTTTVKRFCELCASKRDVVVIWPVPELMAKNALDAAWRRLRKFTEETLLMA